jgi:diacylglycerol kinase (ATP)
VVRKGTPDVRPDGVVLTRKRHYVIFNPASGRGRGATRIDRYRGLLDEALDDVTYGATTRPGEERDLAEAAVADGYDVIVAVGGDGTWGNVADRLVASERDDVALGILPSGTGNDFGRNFGYDPRSPDQAVRAIAEGHTRLVDVGRVDTLSASEDTPDVFEPRHFLNVIGFGFDIAVIDAAKGARFLRGEVLYKVTALQQLFRFPGLRVGVATSSGEELDSDNLMLTVSNARYFGGGFPITPAAEVDDGRLHACIIGDASPLTRLKLFNLAERGRHIASDRVTILDDDGFRLRFAEPPRFEMDGDVRKSSDATIDVRVLPRALSVLVPAS